MREIFERNLAILARRWPELAQRIEFLDVGGLEAELREGRESTLVINRVQLSSRHDRAGEARMQAASLPPGAPVIHLYGVGLGDLPVAFLARPGLVRLEIHLLNETLFALLLQLLDQTAWLEDTRVCLSLAGDAPEICQPFFVSPPELVLASDYNAKIRDRLEAEVGVPFANIRLDPNDPERVARLEGNLALFRQDQDVATLFNTLSGGEVYVAATGPSLARHYATLGAARSRGIPLIAVDTALRPLLENGVRPDLVVSMDQFITARALPGGAASRDIGLVYFPMLEHALLASWEGTRYGTLSRSPSYERIRQQASRAELYADGSVLHPAVDLAVRMGAGQVTLFGADFAYVGEQTHAGWQAGELGPVMASAHWVLNGHGQRVKTLLNLRAYLCSLERYIAAHPQVRFLNTCRDGAWIAGTHYHPEIAP